MSVIGYFNLYTFTMAFHTCQIDQLNPNSCIGEISAAKCDDMLIVSRQLPVAMLMVVDAMFLQ